MLEKEFDFNESQRSKKEKDFNNSLDFPEKDSKTLKKEMTILILIALFFIVIGHIIGSYTYIFDESPQTIVGVPAIMVIQGGSPNPINLLNSFCIIITLGMFAKVYIKIKKYKNRVRKEKFLKIIDKIF